MTTAAVALKARLRTDLAAAMKARRSGETSLLRVLLAALDNAEAVSVGDAHDRYQARLFGDAGVEAPRRVLSETDIADLLTRECADRTAAAAEFDALGRSEDAQRLRAESALIACYL
jgi:hypothetical protein